MNRLAREQWSREAAQSCAHCGYARVNVVHETDRATAPEGPAYYAHFLRELHVFVPEPPGRRAMSRAG